MGSGSGNDLEQANRTQVELMRRYKEVGLPALQQTQGYIRGALGQGEPAYVGAAYDAARSGAAEQAGMATNNALGGLGRPTASGSYLQSLVNVGASGGRAFAEETGQIRTTQALARLDQKNKMLGLLAGQGADATNLSAGFGRLGLQGLGMQNQGSSTYELLTGLGATGAAGYLSYLQNRPPGQGTSSGG